MLRRFIAGLAVVSPAVRRAVDRQRSLKSARTRVANERAPVRDHVDTFRRRLGLDPWPWPSTQGEN